jgi:hypothetical protein
MRNNSGENFRLFFPKKMSYIFWRRRKASLIVILSFHTPSLREASKERMTTRSEASVFLRDCGAAPAAVGF